MKSRGRSIDEIRRAFLALKRIMLNYEVNEVKTIDTVMLLHHLELMEKYNLSFFDSLIASSALTVDGVIISDDKSFDLVEGLKRIPITAN